MSLSYGRTLNVNLSTWEISVSETEPAVLRKFIGGMGLSADILFREVGQDVDPLSPENIIIFANGPLTGTKAPSSGRTEITTKSALTNGIGTGNTGGLWGTYLRRAGIDNIVIRGSSDEPVYLWINDASIEIKKARHIWGKDTRATAAILKQELGSSTGQQVSVLAIGPAGENLVKYACPINDDHHCAARGGIGAVMGSKKLKAIAVHGTGSPSIAKPSLFEKATREARERLLAAEHAMKVMDGSLEPRQVFVEQGSLPGRNFQTGSMPGWLETRGIDVAKRYYKKKDSVCYSCPVGCFNLAEIPEGKYAGLTVNRCLMPGVALCWGAMCSIESLEAIWKCKETCQEMGMDYESAGVTVAFAMELYQRGILTKSDADGLDLSWGNEVSTIRLLHKIAFREGIGDILAEGTVGAAARIGKGAENYAMVIKGLEIAMLPDPRAQGVAKGWLFDSLTNPRGGDNMKGTHFRADKYNPNWWTDKFDMFEDVKKKIYCVPPEEIGNSWEGKALMAKWFEDLCSAVSCAGLCFYPFLIQLALGPTHLSMMLSSCNGWDISPEEVMMAGERSFNLLKAYAVRQGFTRKDDMWPKRFFTEPLPEGPSKGLVLSRAIIDHVLDEYYEARGWDKDLGLPTRDKLDNLGLEYVAEELSKVGKLPI